jgi:membrane-bound metal-dependent hydrolase YbcI (DUF457 family)
MDILTHTLSGIAIGTVVSGFSREGFKSKSEIIALSAIGGALPDIDAISLWSGFDKTFGNLFGLSHAGKDIYVSKFWYSHHGFFHSLLASLILAFVIGLIFYAIQRRTTNHRLWDSLKIHALILTGFISGFIIHLLEDMPTPMGAWGGVRLLWPLKFYFGGTGDIWWWNNYDIFLIVAGCILINVIILIVKRDIHIDISKLTMVVFVIASVLCIIQIKTRAYDFNSPGLSNKYQRSEQKSKEIQHKILGDKGFGFMEKFDRRVPFNF